MCVYVWSIDGALEDVSTIYEYVAVFRETVF